MSTARTLKFSLSSYWRVGSGKGAEAMADALVLRDESGLPIIPGRAVKGLLRDAMSLATLSGTVTPERVEQWFGTELPVAAQTDGKLDSNQGDAQEIQLEEGRFTSREASLWFGSATLPKSWRDWAREHGPEQKDVLNSLFTYQSSTAIDEHGMARDHSLRVTEVAVPMELRAEIRGPEDDLGWVEDLKASLPLLRAMGSRRSRGLGRVEVTLEESR